MKKPEFKTQKYLDYSECTKFIEAKYKIDTRDYAKSHLQYCEWCDSMGYGINDKDPDGCSRGDSRIWFAQYRTDLETGKIIERPYQDWWHWLIDVADVRRGGFLYLKEDLGDDSEQWQKAILALYLKEFGNSPYLTDW